MYAPCRPRPKKTSILRERTGCHTCRRRRRKCDEAKPTCDNCKQKNIQCEGYFRPLDWRDTTDETAERVQRVKGMNHTAPDKFQQDKFQQSTLQSKINRTVDAASSSPSDQVFIFSSENPQECKPSSDSDQRPPVQGDSVPTRCIPSISNYLDPFSPLPLTPDDIQVPLQRPPSRWACQTSFNQGADLFVHQVHQVHKGHEGHQESWTRISNVEQIIWADSCGQASSVHNKRRQEHGRSQATSSCSVYRSSIPASLDLYPNRTATPSRSRGGFNIPVFLLLKENEYVSHYHLHLAKQLFGSVGDFHNRLSTSLILRLSVSAASAMHLGYLKTNPQKDRNISCKGSTEHSSRDDSYTYAQEGKILYQDALRQLQSGIRLYNKTTTSRNELENMLAACLLLAFLELVAGTVSDFQKHIHGAQLLLQQGRETLLTSEFGYQLLQTCFEARAILKLTEYESLVAERVYPLTSQENRYITDVLKADLMPHLSRRTQILNLLGDSFAIRRLIIVNTFTKSYSDLKTKSYNSSSRLGDQSAPLNDSPLNIVFWGLPKEEVKDAKIYNDKLFRLLSAQRQELENWHDRLELCDLPIQRFSKSEIRKTSPVLDDDLENLRPLEFQSPEAALNYAYYALTQLLCDERQIYNDLGLKHFGSRDSSVDQPMRPPDSTLSINMWALLLLRITLGIDLSKMTEERFFKLGAVAMFNLTAICASPAVASHILTTQFPRLEAQIPLLESMGRTDEVRVIKAGRLGLLLIESEAREGRKALDILSPGACRLRSEDFWRTAIEYTFIILGYTTDGSLYRHNCIIRDI